MPAARAPATRRILGIDPGTRVAGWGVVDVSGNRSRFVACGVVRAKGDTMAERLLAVRDGLRCVVASHRPTVLAVERPFFGKNAASAMAVGMARGVALVTAAEAGLAIHEYPPATVKRAVAGNGNASKEQVGRMVALLLGLAAPPEPADAADALAVALADAHRAPLADAAAGATAGATNRATNRATDGPDSPGGGEGA